MRRSLFVIFITLMPNVGLTAPIISETVSFKDLVAIQIMPDSQNTNLFWYTPRYEFVLCPQTQYKFTDNNDQEQLNVSFQICAVESEDQERQNDIKRARQQLGPQTILKKRPLLATKIVEVPPQNIAFAPAQVLCSNSEENNRYLCNIGIRGKRAITMFKQLFSNKDMQITYMGMGCFFSGVEYKNSEQMVIGRDNILRFGDTSTLVPVIKYERCDFPVMGIE